jgi:hypothetical protein
MVRGTWPPNSVTMRKRRGVQVLGLVAEESGGADDLFDLRGLGLAICSTVFQVAKSSGVTVLTRASVHWADRIVATSSSHGVVQVSSVRGSG